METEITLQDQERAKGWEYWAFAVNLRRLKYGFQGQLKMSRTELQEVLRNGEISGIEFKRDDIDGDILAIEIVALANHSGGLILLGVEDDGTISGITRERGILEEWVMNACRDKIRPEINPSYEFITDAEPGKTVSAIVVLRKACPLEETFRVQPLPSQGQALQVVLPGADRLKFELCTRHFRVDMTPGPRVSLIRYETETADSYTHCVYISACRQCTASGE